MKRLLISMLLLAGCQQREAKRLPFTLPTPPPDFTLLNSVHDDHFYPLDTALKINSSGREIMRIGADESVSFYGKDGRLVFNMSPDGIACFTGGFTIAQAQEVAQIIRKDR